MMMIIAQKLVEVEKWLKPELKYRLKVGREKSVRISLIVGTLGAIRKSVLQLIVVYQIGLLTVIVLFLVEVEPRLEPGQSLHLVLTVDRRVHLHLL